MGDGDNVTTPDSMDRGIAEEKYKENETKDDEIETKNPVHTPPVDMEECVGKKINNKNDRLDEETSKVDNSDSVIPKVNDAERTSITIPVGIEEGCMDRGAAE